MTADYKFESAKDHDAIPIERQLISIGNLKERVFYPSNWEGHGFRPQDCQCTDKWRLQIEDKFEDIPLSSSSVVGEPSLMQFTDQSKWDEFGDDLYNISEVVPVQSVNATVAISPANKADEDIKIKALVDTPALYPNYQGHGAYGIGRGFGRGRGGRMMHGHGFGPGGGLEHRTPPAGYVCHRCKVQGHFIEHCPMNADYNCHSKRVKPPTGIVKSVLASRDVSYALPSGAVAVLKPNEAAFEKKIEGLPSTWPVRDLPPELLCPLCKGATKDAVFTSKCCFSSFCEKCIGDYIISKSMCVCGATNILADDLLPNKILRETINLVLEFATSSTENAGSLVQVQGMESACPYPEALSPTMLSAASKDEHKLHPIEQSVDLVELEVVSDERPTNVDQKAAKNVVSSNPTPEPVSGKEPTSQGSTSVPDDPQEKLLVGEQASGKQGRAFRDIGAENFARMPMAPSTYNSCWAGGMSMGRDGYMSTLAGAMPYMGCIPGPFDASFGGLLPQDPFGGQGYILPLGPQREHSIVRGNGSEASSSADGPSMNSKPMKDDQSYLLKHGSYGAVEDGGNSYEKNSSPWNSPLNSIQQLLNLSCYNCTPCDPNDPASADATGTTNVATSISPRRRRKKPQENSKRCNCKKSKCLKLYCECLAAGVFCAKTCGCQECYNINRYEDLLSEVRKHIVSRNPNAFTPKVILDPLIHNDNGAPVSARHRRGCNCKKSHCMKKYCECYQASVRCSHGCQCEGCGNTYGRKDGGYPAGGGFGRASFCSPSPNAPLQQSDCSSVSSDWRRAQFLGGYIPPEESSVFNLLSSLDSNSQADQTSNQCCFAKERLLDERTAISTLSPSNHSFQNLGVYSDNANANWSLKTRSDRVLRQVAIQGGGCAIDAPATTLNKVNKRIVALECAAGDGGLKGSAYYDAHATPESCKENRRPTNTNGADANPFKWC